MANQAVLEKVLADEEFVKELAEMENPEEVQAALNAKGAEITVDEVKVIAKSLSQQAEGELDEDALEDVAGGASGDTLSPAAIDAFDRIIREVNNIRRW